MDHVHAIVEALQPLVLVLFFGVVAAMSSRALRLSPIVGYLALGVAAKASGLVDPKNETIELLAELGVVFLLFDIGLHFSLRHIREQAADIFGFGPVQVALGALALGAGALALGFPLLPALLLGATLALSSTAVVAGLLAERRQQNCPVGLTATAILIFQDIAAIFLLIVVVALGGGSDDMAAQLAMAVVKAATAFGVAFLLARMVVRPLFDLIARTDNAEVFTASALLVALAASWATGTVGLSLTLGAFLGGVIIAETPYRPIIQAETKPFRNLLLSFFFISVGMSLDLHALSVHWPAILAVAAAIIAVKIVTNALSGLIFRWSAPGSLQLGFLLAQGSEFAFVILSLAPMRLMIGARASAVVIAAVALSLALTPFLARAGRAIAGRLRARAASKTEHELVSREFAAPVLIVGMGRMGRTVADALTEFDIAYAAVEQKQKTFAEANADGYDVLYGDASDPRLWDPLELRGRKIVVITTPNLPVSRDLSPLTARFFPHIKRLSVAETIEERDAFRELGMFPVIDVSTPPGLDLAVEVLCAVGIDRRKAMEWALAHETRATVVEAA
ncbi:cation:proton antiporter [Methylocella sp.]|uniref:cation:proton antiporter domain-containing protein n=1 Tax=Methylocella sp. TaxID=1978226 RepID=UPI003784B303